MMDWTDRHDRYFLRLITRRALLYTEMIPTGAILRGDRDRFLGFDPAERPLGLQLGGAEPADLAICAAEAAARGYHEVNLNVGCPSDRVQNARFGACLMAEPELVADCVAAMAASSPLPVTVKTRIGIDERDSYDDLAGFVERVRRGGCERFIIHARKAWLQGLSPKQNREIPPLHYDRVHRLKRDFPDLEIVLNGGLQTLEAAEAHLAPGDAAGPGAASGPVRLDGVMLGRAAYQNPYLLAEVDRRVFGETRPPPERAAVARAMMPYAEAAAARGTPVKSITRHMLGLFNGLPGARLWRRHLSETAHRSDAGPAVIAEALERVLAAQSARAAA